MDKKEFIEDMMILVVVLILGALFMWMTVEFGLIEKIERV